jgi:Zn-dependent protease with chaperone function
MATAADLDGSSLQSSQPSRTVVLLFPSGTLLRYALLLFMVLAGTLFVGEWMFLSTAASPLAAPPWQWRVAPPVLVVLVTVGLVMLAPAWLERRHGWKPVDATRGRAALTRFDDLVGQEGLRHPPELVWSPRALGSSALAYGRPGRYRIAVTPTLLGAARRKPEVFDAVLRHELAHLARRDVVPAYVTVVIWYVALVALAIPLAWRVVDHDLSLVGDYVVRVAFLVVAVFLVRASVLRTREHYADLGSYPSPENRAQTIDVLRSTPAVTSRRVEALSLHPPVEARVQVLQDPAALGRLQPLEFFAVGFTAMWSIPLLEPLLTSLGLNPLTSAGWAASTMFALVGAYCGAVLARWAGSSVVSGGQARAAAGLFMGTTVGSVASLGYAGLLPYTPTIALAWAAAGMWAAAYFVVLTEVARVAAAGVHSRHGASAVTAVLVVGGTCVFALMGAAVNGIVELLEIGFAGGLPTAVLWLPDYGWQALALAVVLALISAAAMLAGPKRWRDALVGLGTASVWAMVALGGTLGGRAVLDLSEAGQLDRYYLLTVTFIVAAAAGAATTLTLAGRGAQPFAFALVTVLIASLGFVLLNASSTEPAVIVEAARDLAKHAAALSALLVPIPAACASLIRARAERAGTPRR